MRIRATIVALLLSFLVVGVAAHAYRQEPDVAGRIDPSAAFASYVRIRATYTSKQPTLVFCDSATATALLGDTPFPEFGKGAVSETVVDPNCADVYGFLDRYRAGDGFIRLDSANVTTTSVSFYAYARRKGFSQREVATFSSTAPRVTLTLSGFVSE
jgi:hypothetical protein